MIKRDWNKNRSKGNDEESKEKGDDVNRNIYKNKNKTEKFKHCEVNEREIGSDPEAMEERMTQKGRQTKDAQKGHTDGKDRKENSDEKRG